jgi:hypothetical protein
LSYKTKKVKNRVATALRLAANSLRRSKSWLGQKFRGLLIRKEAAKAITAMAHKLARIVYALLTKGENYVAKGAKELEEKARAARIRSLESNAKSLGFQLVEKPVNELSDSQTAPNSTDAHNNSRESTVTPNSVDMPTQKAQKSPIFSTSTDLSTNRPPNLPVLTTNLLNALVNKPSDSPAVFNTEDKNIPQSKHKNNIKSTKQKQKGQSKIKKAD